MLRFLPLLVFLLLAILFAAGLLLHASDKPAGESVVKLLPPFDMTSLADEKLRITEDWKKGEPYLINFFASWCTVCELENPVLEKISAEYPVLGVAWKDKPEDTRRWLEKHGNPYTEIAMDPRGLLLELGGTGVPETYVIDRMGSIRYRIGGGITEQDWQKTLLPLLVKLKAE